MEIAKDKRDDVVILSPKGKLDMGNSIELEDAFDKIIAETKKVIMDLNQIGFIDSSGAGSIIKCNHRIGDGRLMLVSSDENLRVLKKTGIAEYIQVLDTVENALSEINKP